MTASATNAINTTVGADLSLAELLADGIIDAAYSRTVARPLVRNESLAGSPSDVLKFPAWAAVAAASVAETTDLTNTALDPTSVSLTVGEIGVMGTVTDNQQEDDILAGLDGYARQYGKAVADKMDADILALTSGFSNANGDTANGLAQEDILTAIRALESRDVPGTLRGAIHPVQKGQLGLDIVTNGSSVWSGDNPQDARFGPRTVIDVFGVMLGTSTNVPTNTRSTVSVYDGANWGEDALAFVSKREARVEFDRDASFRLTEIVVSARYAVGELIDAYGQALYSSSTA